jgi:hypothetical protein
MIYFFPGLFGWVGIDSMGLRNDISAATYISMSFIIFSLTITAFFWGRLDKHNHTLPKGEYKNEFKVILALGILVGAAFILLEIDEILTPGKPSYSRVYSFFLPMVIVGMIYSIASARYLGIAVFLPLIVLDVFAGNRESMVFSVLGSFIILGQTSDRIRLALKHYRALLSSVAVSYGLLIYKGLYVAMAAGRYDIISDRLLSGDFYTESAMRLESFITLDLLNSVVTSNISYSENWFLATLIILIPMGDIFFPINTQSISSVISEQFYSWTDFGVAGNIWADSHAAGGWLLFFFFSLIYSLMPIVLNIAIARSRSTFISSSICVIGVVVMFFSHRAGLFYTITLLSRFIFLFTLIYIIILIIGRGKLRRKG